MPGVCLGIARVTRVIIQGDLDVDKNYEDRTKELFPGLDWIYPLEYKTIRRHRELNTEADYIAKLCESFIYLNLISSNKVCSECISTLGKHRKTLEHFPDF